MKKEHYEILMEEMSSKFNLVLEGHASLHQEIRDFSQKTDERFDLVDVKINALNQKIDGVEEKLTKKIDGVEDKLTKKIDGVAADLKATDERLCKKIDGVEANLTKKIDGVAADLKAHRADTEAHHGVYRVKES